MSGVAHRLHARVDGAADAPAVVMLGSLGSELAIWDPQVRELHATFRIVRLDLRGHGGSPVPPGPYDIADLGADVLATLDSLGVDRASLCGISLGGAVALWLAANAAERVDRLVVCFSSACFGGREAWLGRAGLVRADGTDAVAEAAVGRWFTAEFAARRPDVVTAMRAMIAATPAEGYAACCEALAEFDLRAELGAIRAPTLVISGGADPATPPEHGELIAAGVAGATFVELAELAHLGSFERPDLVTPLIGSHLPKEARDE